MSTCWTENDTFDSLSRLCLFDDHEFSLASSYRGVPAATEERYEQVIEYGRDRSTAGKPPFLRPMNLAKHENDSHQRIDATDFEIIQDSDYEKLMH